MHTSSKRLTEWLDIVVELTRRPDAVFPRSVLARQLSESFGCYVAWNWVNRDGSFGFETDDVVPGFPDPTDAEAWVSEGMTTHPLVRWYATTLDPRPMTLGRVPRDLVPRRGYDLVVQTLTRHGIEQQLSLPHRLSPDTFLSFVLARPQDDFTDEDLELARSLQPLFAMLERQADVLAQTQVCPDAVLTGRELAVLRVLAEGMTAVAIGHRLLISPRTAHAHLRNIYAKLGVRDRLQAVLVAEQMGLLRGPAEVDPTDDTPRLRWSGVSPRPLLSPSPVVQGATSRPGSDQVADRPDALGAAAGRSRAHS